MNLGIFGIELDGRFQFFHSIACSSGGYECTAQLFATSCAFWGNGRSALKIRHCITWPVVRQQETSQVEKRPLIGRFPSSPFDSFALRRLGFLGLILHIVCEAHILFRLQMIRLDLKNCYK